MDDAVDLA